MGKSYIVTPTEVAFSKLIANGYKLSAKSQKALLLLNNNYKTIRELLIEPAISGREPGSLAYVRQSNFRFLKTKAIQGNSFILDFDTVGTYENIKPKDFILHHGNLNQRTISKDDVLFVTGGNVGEVAIAQEDYSNTIFSSHIYKLPLNENKLYIFAFLKNAFCKDQANFSPEGSIAGLDSFKIDYLLDIKIPFPKKNIKNSIRFIEALTQAIIEKERKIKHRHSNVLLSINEELQNNQKKRTFSFTYPNISEIQSVGRLDTFRYSEKYKAYEFLVRNYTHGSFRLSDIGLKSKRGPNLAVSVIGPTFYNNDYRPGFYKLVVSSNFSEYSTLERYVYMGVKKLLPQLTKGDIVFSSRGAQLGRAVVLLEDVNNTITNFDSLIIHSERKTELYQNLFVMLFLNNLRWNKHVYSISFYGSGANSLTQYQLEEINFPNFPIKKQKELANSYFNEHLSYNIGSCDIDSFADIDKEFNEKAGIYQLHESCMLLKRILDRALDQIIRDEEVDIHFQ